MQQPEKKGQSPRTAQRLRFAELAGHATRAFRRFVGTVAWIFPLGYLLAVCSAAGVLRKEFLAHPAISRFLQILLVPPEFLYAKVFAVPLAYRGVDAVLVGCAVLSIVLREVILAPLRKLEDWADAEQELVQPKPRLRRKRESAAAIDRVGDLAAVKPHVSLSALGKVRLASQDLTRGPVRAS